MPFVGVVAVNRSPDGTLDEVPRRGLGGAEVRLEETLDHLQHQISPLQTIRVT